ncbi:MAG: ATP-binding protein [Chloroflexota bacterium]|nr:ATP-binding protein [Chloroflexota bacterium]
MPSKKQHAKTGRRVLIVEDDQGLAHLIRKSLESIGLQVKYAGMGAEAIEMASGTAQGLLLLDYRLPDMTGKQVIDSVRARGMDIPFVVMTGHGDERIAVEMMKLGARDYLAKDTGLLDLLPGVVTRVFDQLETERRLNKAESELRESQRSLTTLMGNLPGMAYRCLDDDRRTMIFVSSGCIGLTGYQPSDLQRNSRIAFIQLVHKEDREMVLGNIQMAVEQKCPFQLTYRIFSANGAEKWVLEKGAGIYSDNCQIEGVEGFIMDVTERKHVEQERERLNDELTEKNKELEQIIYATSHELRSPLVNIQGFTKELDHSVSELYSDLDNKDIPPEVRKKVIPIVRSDMPDALQYIHGSVEKMGTLVDGLLKLSRAGTVALNVEGVDMNRLVSDIEDSFEYAIREKNVSLHVESLVPCKGDSVQINQVFSNLIGNALKYLDPERPGVVKISNKSVGDYVTYCVEDNGIGIPEEDREKVFETFQRLDPQTTSGEGLGLTIVKKILSRHDGKVWVESEPGVGSRFNVLLPSGDKEWHKSA